MLATTGPSFLGRDRWAETRALYIHTLIVCNDLGLQSVFLYLIFPEQVSPNWQGRWFQVRQYRIQSTRDLRMNQPWWWLASHYWLIKTDWFILAERSLSECRQGRPDTPLETFQLDCVISLPSEYPRVVQYQDTYCTFSSYSVGTGDMEMKGL